MENQAAQGYVAQLLPCHELFFLEKFCPFPALLGLSKMFFSFMFLWETLTREWDTTSQNSKLHFFLLKPNLTSHLHAIMKPHQFEFDIMFWPISALMSKTMHQSQLTFNTFSDTCLWSCQQLLAAPRGWQGTRKNGGHQFELVAVDPLRFRQLLVLLEKFEDRQLHRLQLLRDLRDLLLVFLTLPANEVQSKRWIRKPVVDVRKVIYVRKLWLTPLVVA